MGATDFYADGEWFFYCDLCGKREHSSKGVKTWDNFYVCRRHKEARNPQDFVRGVKDDPSVPWTRPNSLIVPAELFCTLEGLNAVPGFAVSGCAISGYNNIQVSDYIGNNDNAGVSVCTLAGMSSIPTYAIAGCMISGNGNYPL